MRNKTKWKPEYTDISRGNKSGYFSGGLIQEIHRNNKIYNPMDT